MGPSGLMVERKKGFSANNSDNEEERERRAGNYKRRQEGKGRLFSAENGTKTGTNSGWEAWFTFPLRQPRGLKEKVFAISNHSRPFPG